MENLFTGVQRVVASWGPEAEAALKRARNKDRFRAAVERTWKTRPDVARFILMHTSSIYITEDKRPRRGPDRDRPWWVFGIYLDNAMARTEVDAWQAKLLTCLRSEGFSIDELRFHPSTWEMRQRRLFPDLWKEEGKGIASAGGNFTYRDEARALDIVKKAVFLVFEDTEQAWAFLEKVRGATLREVFIEDSDGALWMKDGMRHGPRKYQLFLYVDDVEGMRTIERAFGRAIRSRCYTLGLRVSAIWIREAPLSLAGQHAFQRVGASVPLRDEDLRREAGKVTALVEASSFEEEPITSGLDDFAPPEFLTD